MSLLPQHADKVFNVCGITQSVAEAAGLYSIDNVNELTKLGFSAAEPLPALAIPIYGTCGTHVHTQIRQDTPLNPKRKYLFPAQSKMALYTPPMPEYANILADPTKPLIITEGALKALSCTSYGIPTLAVSGVYNFRGRNDYSATQVIPDFEFVTWCTQDKRVRRVVLLCFDSDVMTKPQVRDALIRLRGILERLGANVLCHFFDPLADGTKCGLDDYLVSNSVSDIWELITHDNTREAIFIARPKVCTHGAIAEEFIRIYCNEVAYVREMKSWYVFNGDIWERDDADWTLHLIDFLLSQVVYDIQQNLRRAKSEEDNELTRVCERQLAAYSKMRNVEQLERILKMARALRCVKWFEFDANPNYLAVNNGVINLSTRELLPYAHDMWCTFKAPVNYIVNAAAPEWGSFIGSRWPDAEMREYVQSITGEFIVGASRTKALYVFRGDAHSGKTTYLSTLQLLLGDNYVGLTHKELLLSTERRQNATERYNVDLDGKRMVYVDESNERDRIDASTVKNLTGGAIKLRARRLYGEAYTFDMNASIVLATNFMPRANARDRALWDRIHLVDFGEGIFKDERIEGAAEAIFLHESSGILNWILEGYYLKQEQGLVVPTAFQLQLTEERKKNNPIEQFASECLVSEPGSRLTSSTIFGEYVEWCEFNDREPVNTNVFGRSMTYSGYCKEKRGGDIYYLDVALAPNLQED